MNKENIAEYAADIRAALNGTITAYWMSAPESAIKPYMVFNISSFANGKRIDCDLWDVRGKEVALLGLAETVEALLDGIVIFNRFHSSVITSDQNKQYIADDDDRIIHINMSFGATYQS